LIVLDSLGNTVETIFGSLINGPWDMTVDESDREAKLFVTNVLNGTVAASGSPVTQGTVLRIDLGVSRESMPWVESMTVVGSGFSERTDPAALVVGPTGVGLSPARDGDEDRDDENAGHRDARSLYVADSLNNRIAAIPHALTRANSAGIGFTLSEGGSLNDPLGLVVAPNGHILTVNGDDGFIIEITPRGHQIATKLLDNTGGPPPGNGTLFGLVFDPELGVVFVDDGSNTLNLLH
jgi:DNA-binding beta-propeller fold protein YncE